MTDSEGSIFRSNVFRISLGLMVGAVLLYLSVRDVSWSELKADFKRIDLTWILIALCLYWMELALRIARWRALTSHIKPPIAAYQTAIAFLSGYAANNVLPAKLGEAFRADLLGRLADVSRLSAFGSIIVERLFDMALVLCMTAWGVIFVTTTRLDAMADVNKGLALLVPVIAVLVIGVYILVAGKGNFLHRRFARWSVKLENLIHGLRVINGPADYVTLLARTVAIWGFNCLAIWSILMALDVQLNVNQTIMLIGITGIASALPAAPAGIGTLQYAFHIAALLFGFSASAALVASAMVQVALLGSATVLGGIAYGYALSTHLLLDASAKP